MLDEPGGAAAYASGGAAAAAAFDAVIPGGFGGRVIQFSLILFALSSIVCWCYYGEAVLTIFPAGSGAVRTVYKLILCCSAFWVRRGRAR